MTTVESIQKWKNIKHVCNKNMSGQNCNWVIYHHECDLCNIPVYFVCKKWENGEKGILFKLKLKIMQWTNFNTFLHVRKEMLQKIVLISYFKSVCLPAYNNLNAVEKILVNSHIDNLCYNLSIQSDFGYG